MNPLSPDYHASCLVLALASLLASNKNDAATGLLDFALQMSKEDLLFVAASHGECAVLEMKELLETRQDPKNWIHLVRAASTNERWAAVRVLIGNSLSCTTRFRLIGNSGVPDQLQFLCEAVERNNPQELEAILRGTTTKDRDAIKYFIGKLPAFSISPAQIDAAFTLSSVSTPGA